MPSRDSSLSRPPAKRGRRPSAGWVLGPRRNNSLRAGIIGTILVHLLLVWLLPKFENHFLDGDALGADAPADDPSKRQFDIEIEPDPPPPLKFVEANPDAPDNVPDKTDQFSDRNQQLAQEQPPEQTGGDMPSTKGMEGIDSTAIVTGNDAQNNVQAPPTPPTPESEQQDNLEIEQPELAALAKDPLPGVEDMRGDNETSFGTNVVKLPENPQADVEKKVDGVKDPEKASPTGTGLYYRPDPSRPATRPLLSQSQIRPAVFAERIEGTENMGVVAHNALKTDFGVYYQKMLGVIGQGWHYDIQAKTEARVGFPLAGSKVTVSFTLNQDGSVRIDRVDGNSGPLWDSVAVESIAAPARVHDGFGKWPQEMINILGESTPIRITFFYQ